MPSTITPSLITMQQLFNGKHHFYSISEKEIIEAKQKAGDPYHEEIPTFQIMNGPFEDESIKDTVPLYRYNNGHVNYLTTDQNDPLIEDGRFKQVGVAGYVWTEPKDGVVPVYLSYKDNESDFRDYYYTANEQEYTKSLKPSHHRKGFGTKFYAVQAIKFTWSDPEMTYVSEPIVGLKKQLLALKSPISSKPGATVETQYTISQTEGTTFSWGFTQSVHFDFHAEVTVSLENSGELGIPGFVSGGAKTGISSTVGIGAGWSAGANQSWSTSFEQHFEATWTITVQPGVSLTAQGKFDLDQDVTVKYQLAVTASGTSNGVPLTGKQITDIIKATQPGLHPVAEDLNSVTIVLHGTARAGYVADASIELVDDKTGEKLPPPGKPTITNRIV